MRKWIFRKVKLRRVKSHLPPDVCCQQIFIKGYFAIITLEYYYICRGGECYFESDISSVSNTGDFEKGIKPMTFLLQVQMLCHCVNSWQLTCQALCVHRLSRHLWSVFFVYVSKMKSCKTRNKKKNQKLAWSMWPELHRLLGIMLPRGQASRLSVRKSNSATRILLMLRTFPTHLV